MISALEQAQKAFQNFKNNRQQKQQLVSPLPSDYQMPANINTGSQPKQKANYLENVSEAIGNFFQPQKKELLSPLPANQTMGTKEYNEQKFWDMADYKDALESEVAHLEATARRRAIQEVNSPNSEWIPIREDNIIRLGKNGQVQQQQQARVQLHQATPDDLKEIIYMAAEKYGIPANEFSNLLARESMNFRPDVMYGRMNSPVGARGVGQFMPETAKWFADTHYQQFDPVNPEEAIPASAAYLNYIKEQYGFPDWQSVYAAYNAGPGRVNSAINKYGDIQTALPYLPTETQNYVPAVLGVSTTR